MSATETLTAMPPHSVSHVPTDNRVIPATAPPATYVFRSAESQDHPDQHRLRCLADALSMPPRSPSHALSKSLSHTPRTPVFIPPMTPRSSRAEPGSPATDRLETSTHKRTASAAGMLQGYRDDVRIPDRKDRPLTIKEEPFDPVVPPPIPDSGHGQNGGEERGLSSALTQSVKRQRGNVAQQALVPPLRASFSDPLVTLHDLARPPEFPVYDPGRPSLTSHPSHLHVLGEDPFPGYRRANDLRSSGPGSSSSAQSGVAARRGLPAQGNRLTLETRSHPEAPLGIKSAPLRPAGFSADLSRSQPAPITAFPVMTTGQPGTLQIPQPHNLPRPPPVPSLPTSSAPAPADLPSTDGMPGVPRAAFLSVFGTLYDAYADARNLDERVRRSYALHSTLHQRCASMESVWEKKLENLSMLHTKEIQLLEKRLERMEQKFLSAAALSRGVPDRLTRVGHATSSVREFREK